MIFVEGGGVSLLRLEVRSECSIGILGAGGGGRGRFVKVGSQGS